MPQLPDDCQSYRRTPIFDQHTIPPGLLKSHQTKAGTWGKIVVLEGSLRYRILEPEIDEYLLDRETCGIVEPGVLHEVAPVDSVRFYVDFHRRPGVRCA